MSVIAGEISIDIVCGNTVGRLTRSIFGGSDKNQKIYIYIRELFNEILLVLEYISFKGVCS